MLSSRQRKNTSSYLIMYADERNYWSNMKKFSQYINERVQEDDIQHLFRAAKKDDILRMFSHLDEHDRLIVKRTMLQIFDNMMTQPGGFARAVKFILRYANLSGNPVDKQGVSDSIERAKEFFSNPITRGLGYVDGENQIINTPNPNENGATNNSYYN